MVVANGEPLQIIGAAEVVIQVADTNFTHEALVTDEVFQECLLGADFLVPNGFVIDFKTGALHHGTSTTALTQAETTQIRRVCRVSLANTSVIWAGEERLLWGDVHHPHDTTLKYAGVMEPKEGFEARHQVLVARVVAVPDGKIVPVRVANLSPVPITLYRGLRIGSFCPLATVGEDPGGAEYQELPPVEIKMADTPQFRVQHIKQKSAADVLGVNTQDMDDALKQELEDLLHDFNGIFSTGRHDLGRTNQVYHKINTGDAPPIKLTPRRLPFHQRHEVKKLVDEMEKQGVIQPSQSPWAAPIVLVRKRDGSIRFCVDYRKLNTVTKKDSYPLPRVDDLLDALADAKWFSTLDLASGYWQVEMDPTDQEKTAFTTSDGLYEFRVMPFGLCNAPSTFQRLMELVLAGLRWEICLAYLDDVVVFGRTFEEHLQRLRVVLSRLEDSNLKLNPKKCQFFCRSAAFLGHVISSDGVSTNPAKVQSVANWQVPINISELRSFLGLAAYYRRFVKNFAGIAAPLYRLLEKEVPFKWTEQCDGAFTVLKQKLITAPVLAYPRIQDTFVLDTDASERGIGAVLSQCQDGAERVIAYGSQTLTKAERNYCATRRELLALVYFIRHFRCYLLGHPFLVRTDHAALQRLQGFKQPEGQVARWLEQLQEFDFRTEHRPGKQHGNADSLSRIPCRQCGQEHFLTQRGEMETESPLTPNVLQANSVTTSHHSWAPSWSMLELRNAQMGDTVLKTVIEWLEQYQERPNMREMEGAIMELRSLWAQWDRLELVQGVLYRRWENNSGNSTQRHLIIPRSLVPTVLQALHDGPAGGHLGRNKTLAKVRERFYWPRLCDDVEEWCQRCLGCATRKSPTKPARAPMVPSRVGNPMERMALDILGPLPVTTRGNKYIIVVCDYFTRWGEAYSLPNQEAVTVARVLVEEWICRFGTPDTIHSDQGRNFESQLFSEVCRLLDIKKTRTTPYHPQSDGLVERLNRTLLTMLSIKANEDQENWDLCLPEIMMAYRTSVHETTGFTPFQLMFGREVRLPLDVMFGGPPEPCEEPTGYAFQLRKRLKEAYELVRQKTQAEQKRQKDSYDRRVSGTKFKIGDRVWLHSPAVPKGQSPKFHLPWKGPFVIVKALSDVTYRIQLEKPSLGQRRKRHRQVVHFNRLKLCRTLPADDDSRSAGLDTQEVPTQPNLEQATSEQSDTELMEDEVVIEFREPNEDIPAPSEIRGGATWSGRLRRMVQPPDFYSANILRVDPRTCPSYGREWCNGTSHTLIQSDLQARTLM